MKTNNNFDSGHIFFDVKYFSVLIITLFLYSSSFVYCIGQPAGTIKFNMKYFNISISENGNITEITDLNTDRNYLWGQSPSPLMSIRVKGDFINPASAEYNHIDSTISLVFPYQFKALISVKQKTDYITFELISITKKDSIELIVWGPYLTNIGKIIGETVGVVQSDDFAVGIQSLNMKTLGGYPWQDNDVMPDIEFFGKGDLSDISKEMKDTVYYRIEAACPTEYGSSLQAYCRNRNTTRIIANWGFSKYLAPPFEDGGILNSKIAIFGSPTDKIMKTIESIEINEGLPHPIINGMWTKTSKHATSAYIIMEYGEDRINESIELTKKAGLKYLYHPYPFYSWGEFLLHKDQFPNGAEGMRNCVKKAAESGISLGIHMLSNFITANDKYVTPDPDKRLAKVFSGYLIDPITKDQTEITINAPDCFNEFKNNNMRTVRINRELIQYETVSETKPWKLLGCKRGSFGTSANSHRDSAEVSLLADHDYKVFLPNSDLNIEMSKRVADFFNLTGLRQISFDGLEGCRSTGMGNYGEILFTNTWYDNISDNIKKHFIADASRTSHFFWHIYTRMNWGEPWFAGFRESQTKYRLKNQEYFARNLMPNMLGWFRLFNETGIEDIEWMLTRSAAYNAGYGFVINFGTIEENYLSDKILNLLGIWERARMARAFPAELIKRMRDINTEFHLKEINAENWIIFQVFSSKFSYSKEDKQSGNESLAEIQFDNPSVEQKVQFIITAADGDAENITLTFDHRNKYSFLEELEAGETIKYEGGNSVILYGRNWEVLDEFEVDPALFIVSQGKHSFKVACDFTDDGNPKLKIEVRCLGNGEKLSYPD